MVNKFDVEITEEKNVPLTKSSSYFPVYGAVPSTITDEEHLKATIQRLVSFKNNRKNQTKYI